MKAHRFVTGAIRPVIQPVIQLVMQLDLQTFSLVYPQQEWLDGIALQPDADGRFRLPLARCLILRFLGANAAHILCEDVHAAVRVVIQVAVERDLHLDRCDIVRAQGGAGRAFGCRSHAFTAARRQHQAFVAFMRRSAMTFAIGGRVWFLAEVMRPARTGVGWPGRRRVTIARLCSEAKRHCEQDDSKAQANIHGGYPHAASRACI